MPQTNIFVQEAFFKKSHNLSFNIMIIWTSTDQNNIGPTLFSV